MPMVSGPNLQVEEMQYHVKGYDKSVLGSQGKLSHQEKLTASIQEDVKDFIELYTHQVQNMIKDINNNYLEKYGDFGYEDEDGYKR